LGIPQELKSLSDRSITGIQLSGTSVCVDGVGDLIVAAFVETSEVKPHFGNIGVDADGTRVRVESVAELVDLEVQDTDGAPERRVTSITVDGLLIRFVCLVVFLTCHVRTTEKIPTLGIRRICFETLCQVLNGGILVLEGRAILMIQPPKLLKDFRVARVLGNNTFVCVFRTNIIFLLLEDMPDLEPYVGVSERTGWISENSVEALERVVVFALLFIDYPQTEKNLV